MAGTKMLWEENLSLHGSNTMKIKTIISAYNSCATELTRILKLNDYLYIQLIVKVIAEL